MEKKDVLALIDAQNVFDRIPTSQLKRICVKSQYSPVKKVGIQCNSSGLFLGYECGQYTCQIAEVEFYKQEK